MPLSKDSIKYYVFINRLKYSVGILGMSFLPLKCKMFQEWACAKPKLGISVEQLDIPLGSCTLNEVSCIQTAWLTLQPDAYMTCVIRLLISVRGYTSVVDSALQLKNVAVHGRRCAQNICV